MSHENSIEEIRLDLEAGGDLGLRKLQSSYRSVFREFSKWIVNSSLYKNSMPIQSLYNIHRGERCFLICNGPSLNRIDMTLLRDEITFGCNRIYIGLEKWGLNLDYWAVQDETQIMQQYDEYPKAIRPDTVKFIPLQFAPWFSESNIENACFPYVEFFYMDYPRFNESNPWFYSGMTVSYWLMQLAFYMGFQEIVIVGMDHSYKITEKEKKGSNRWADASSQSHFDPAYMNASKGQLWNLPDVEKMEIAYSEARKCIESAGRKILNATPGTQCPVFEAVKFEELF